MTPRVNATEIQAMRTADSMLRLPHKVHLCEEAHMMHLLEEV
jgi:hypothetical protein